MSENSAPVFDTLINRVTIRQFTDRQISDELLQAMLDASRRSATSSNLQTYSLVVVRDQDTKDELAVLAGNQKHVSTCSVFIALVADVSRLHQAAEMHGEKLAQNFENSLSSIIDASIIGQSLATLAESYGLGTVMIGGMRRDPLKVAEVLNLPDGAFVVYGLCLGYPDEEKVPPQKPRLPENVVIHHEQYDQRDISADLQAHDKELAEHYRSQGRNTPDAGWTGFIADRFSKPHREGMREVLTKLGLNFD